MSYLFHLLEILLNYLMCYTGKAQLITQEIVMPCNYPDACRTSWDRFIIFGFLEKYGVSYHFYQLCTYTNSWLHQLLICVDEDSFFCYTPLSFTLSELKNMLGNLVLVLLSKVILAKEGYVGSWTESSSVLDLRRNSAQRQATLNLWRKGSETVHLLNSHSLTCW